jgi:predicted Zn-dependent protease
MKKIVFFAVTAIFLSACSNVVLTGRKQLNLVPDAEVLSMSATAYKQFVDSVPASKNAEQTKLVKQVGAKIAAAVESYLTSIGKQAEIANLKWEFNLVQDTSINAFCMPGGKVVFFEGILPVTKTEAGLAVVMGHEIAHAVAKHANERMSQQMAAQLGAGVADMLFSTKSAATRQTINTLYGIGSQVGVLLPYSRKHEYEADRLGLVFMAMAGYDPTEAVNFWERMAAGGKAMAFELLSTHPTDQNRIKNMKLELAEALPYYLKTKK